MTNNDLLDLNRLIECEIIRFELKDDILSMLVVGDNEEDEHHHHDEDEEDDDCDGCCEGLNGHLFLLKFTDVKSYVFDGEECDNYKTINVESKEGYLHLSLEGYNFNEDDSNVNVSFSYSKIEIKDMGEIKGPDA